MGNLAPLRQPQVLGPAPGQPLVAFDFDGTLTVRDSFTDFLRWRVGAVGYLFGMARLTPAALSYLRTKDRGAIKAAAVAEFLDGVDRKTLKGLAETYAEQAWSRLMRPDALACWNDWGAKGAHRVIVTASPEITVAPFARRLGAEALLGTRLVFDHDDRITGAFAGENCRGCEKVTRLKAAYGDDVRLTAAYGDTSGDTEMLAIADRPGFQVFTGRPG
ncbi:HAD-IB family hydrolase [Brevundimonas sp.]|uniref:HAD-IB family hydrolase n=1 Tax=Brevundimonas sp. TaxID=1871086 RepID=UPI0039E5D3B1